MFKKSEEDLIKRSIEYIKNNDFPKAIKILKKTLDQNPTNANALYLMGNITVKQNRTDASDYFDKALNNKQDFEQAWLRKGLILSSRLEFKEALYCIDRVLQLNNFDEETMRLKEDLLFYLRKYEELKEFKKEMFKFKLNEIKILFGKIVCSNDGLLIGEVAETSNQNLFLNPAEFINPTEYKTDKKGRLVFNKKNVSAIGDVIMYKIKRKSQSKKGSVFRKEIILDV